ncbi:hypothetical protein ES332_A06G105300v1 [Gossypium tomentosum]|uniref:Uncharacterized protein n=1 Tax=Gossypium tomentosum TaxID=34277 RepID=A0A5D2Q244_GOSTO|nr:hypothetical protein ES332_A06G105300v1 [Gossypium tomentosum]
MTSIRLVYRANVRTFLETAAAINPQLLGFHLANRRRANI